MTGSPKDGGDWQGPLAPLTPVAPQSVQQHVRTFDYPAGINPQYTPRANEQITFAQLRALAQADDLTRLLIETRKDQVKRQQWQFRLKKSEGESENKTQDRSAKDPRIKALTKFFKKPDGEHLFSDWVGMVLEEVLVIDALAILPRFTLGGELFSLDVIDGGTIHRVITAEGKTPQAPDCAYQQILKGVPAANISAAYPEDPTIPQLVYRPRNPRPNKLYGFSPVEQIVMTVNMAIRRFKWQLDGFTEGNIPEAIVGVGEMNIQQIDEFEQRWNEIQRGDTAAMRRVRFVPGEAAKNITFTKQTEQKNEFDEWLFKIRAFAFSISPQAIVKQMNKASAQESVDASLSEGLSPILQFLIETINLLVETYWGYDDIEFGFKDDKEQSAKDQAEIDDKDIKNGKKSIDEIRVRDGMEPIGVGNFFATATGPVFLENAVKDAKDALKAPKQEPAAAAPGQEPPTPGGQQPAAEQPPPQKIAKGAKAIARISAAKITPKMKRAIPRLTRKIAKFFDSEKKRIAEVISTAYGKVIANKTAADEGGALADRILSELDLDNWVELRGPVTDALDAVFKDGGRSSLVDLEVEADDIILKLIDENAVDYAEKRSAELVGMRITSKGKLVPNPNARWAITSSTRQKIRGLVVDAIEDGLTPAELSESIWEDTAFSESRADMVSRTELAKANVEGNMQGWKESGIVAGKEWLLGSEHGKEDECDENADDGVIKLTETFSSDDEGPPAHPDCVCDVIAVRDANES